MKETPFDILRIKNLRKAGLMPDPEKYPYAGKEYRRPIPEAVQPPEPDVIPERTQIFPYAIGEGVK